MKAAMAAFTGVVCLDSSYCSGHPDSEMFREEAEDFPGQAFGLFGLFATWPFLPVSILRNQSHASRLAV